MLKKVIGFLLLLFSFAAGAQDISAPEMADSFRQEGKIYVVISVIAIIFLALVFFLIYIERKIKKLEDKVNKHNQ